MQQISRLISSGKLVSISFPSRQMIRLERSLLGSDAGWSQATAIMNKQVGNSPPGTGVMRRP